MYARLDAEQTQGATKQRLVELVEVMMEHEEGFLERERCLVCWDGGLRRAALDLAEGEGVGRQVFLPLYPRLVDWLADKLGDYQNVLKAGLTS